MNLLYICEQHPSFSSAMDTAQRCSGSSCSSSSSSEPAMPEAAVAHLTRLQERINECLYNAAVADTLDRAQPQDESRSSAMCKLREVLSRAACATGCGLSLELEGRTLLLLGKLQTAGGLGEDAVDTCATDYLKLTLGSVVTLVHAIIPVNCRVAAS